MTESNGNQVKKLSVSKERSTRLIPVKSSPRNSISKLINKERRKSIAFEGSVEYFKQIKEYQDKPQDLCISKRDSQINFSLDMFKKPSLNFNKITGVNKEVPLQNLSLKRYDGIQKIPQTLKEVNSKQKRHAYFFKKIIKENRKTHQPLSSIFGKIRKFKTKSNQAGDEQDLKRGQTKIFGFNKRVTAERRKSTISIEEINESQQEALEEEDELFTLNERLNMVKSKYMFFPDSYFKIFWDSITFFAILYQSVLLPFRISFQPTLPEWLLCDIVASFPYNWVFAVSQRVSLDVLENASESNIVSNPFLKTPQLFRLLRIARILRVLKLIRVLKISKLFLKIEEHIVTDGMNLFITFFKLMAKIIFIGHWVACFFWYIGSSQLSQFEICWIVKAELLDSPILVQYITSLYWAFTTMITVGYGDITPLTTVERLYSMCAMILASGVFAYTINSIGTIISRYNLLSGQYREQMIYINKLLLAKALPFDLRMKIRRYLEYVWEQKKIVKIEEGEVMAMLNENLREKITVYLNGRILKNMKFFEGFGLDFLSELTFYFKVLTFAIDDFVFIEEEDPQYLYHIMSGKVAMIHKQSHTYLLDLGKDECFGEIGFFTDNPRTLSAKSRDYTELYAIDKAHFLHIAEDYITACPILQQQYHIIRTSLNEESNYYVLRLECYICGKKGHIALKCPFFSTKKGNLNKAKSKLLKEFKEDTIPQRQLGSLSISYIYEEDDPKKNPHIKLNQLVLEKQVFTTLEEANEVKKKNKKLRISMYPKGSIEEQNVLESIYSDVETATRLKKRATQIIDAAVKRRKTKYQPSLFTPNVKIARKSLHPDEVLNKLQIPIKEEKSEDEVSGYQANDSNASEEEDKNQSPYLNFHQQQVLSQIREEENSEDGSQSIVFQQQREVQQMKTRKKAKAKDYSFDFSGAYLTGNFSISSNSHASQKEKRKSNKSNISSNDVYKSTTPEENIGLSLRRPRSYIEEAKIQDNLIQELPDFEEEQKYDEQMLSNAQKEPSCN